MTRCISLAKRSVNLPLPSSPHWVPTTMVAGTSRSLFESGAGNDSERARAFRSGDRGLTACVRADPRARAGRASRRTGPAQKTRWPGDRSPGHPSFWLDQASASGFCPSLALAASAAPPSSRVMPATRRSVWLPLPVLGSSPIGTTARDVGVVDGPAPARVVLVGATEVDVVGVDVVVVGFTVVDVVGATEVDVVGATEVDVVGATEVDVVGPPEVHVV